MDIRKANTDASATGTNTGAQVSDQLQQALDRFSKLSEADKKKAIEENLPLAEKMQSSAPDSPA